MASILPPIGSLPLTSTAPTAYELESTHRSGVSWAAIFAGAAAAAALSLILLILGTGLGLSSISPWTGQGASATTFGISTIAWLTLTQLAASGLGGYLAGRLRSKWVAVHTDEVYFRDTAHGFLAWAVATLVTAAMLTSAIGSVLGSGAKAGAAVASGAISTAATGVAAAGAVVAKGGGDSGSSTGLGYYVDSLFRKAPAAADAASAAGSSPANSPRTDVGNPVEGNASEVARIFANAISTGTLSPEDTRYVGQLVAQRTGITQAEAEKRVTDTFNAIQTKLKQAETAARDAADTARKASAGAALWIFVSLLIGAFAASLSATYGGRRRDL